MIGRLYLEHLTDGDLTLLAGVSERSSLGSDPDALVSALDNPAAYRAVFNEPARDPLFLASPFLLFSLLIHRAARDLSQASFIDEWVGPGQRVPVFDVGGLREFGADPARRFFLAELLSSYTHVASGSVMVQTRRGWRRQRFSELDPLRLIELAELLPEAERPSVYRRLGDERRDGVWLLERVGQRAYRIAHRAADRRGAMTDVLGAVSENFATARRVLNFLTDRYLFPQRQRWFGFG
ncbi:MAG: hypothetical protein E6I88_01180 [Chloroflexi bacterium]|nr:MAG: hypothetical protein E6I88_01180 [Chloroflexota bacterium]